MAQLTVKDAYSTDAKIEENDLVVLEDDLRFFPKYDSVFLFRSSMPPDAIGALRRLEGTLDEKRMIHLYRFRGNRDCDRPRWRRIRL